MRNGYVNELPRDRDRSVALASDNLDPDLILYRLIKSSRVTAAIEFKFDDIVLKKKLINPFFSIKIAYNLSVPAATHDRNKPGMPCARFNMSIIKSGMI